MQAGLAIVKVDDMLSEEDIENLNKEFKEDVFMALIWDDIFNYIHNDELRKRISYQKRFTKKACYIKLILLNSDWRTYFKEIDYNVREINKDDTLETMRQKIKDMENNLLSIMLISE